MKKLDQFENIRLTMNSYMNSVNKASTNIKNQAENVLKETRDIINALPYESNAQFSEHYRKTLLKTHGYEDITKPIFETEESKNLEKHAGKQLALMANFNLPKRFMELITILYKGNIFNTNNVYLTDRCIDNISNILNGKKLDLGDKYEESIKDFLEKGWLKREAEIRNEKAQKQNVKTLNLRNHKFFSRLDSLIREGWFVIDHYQARPGDSQEPEMVFHMFKTFNKRFATVTTLIFNSVCEWSSETYRTSLTIDGWDKISKMWYTKLREQEKIEEELEKELQKQINKGKN